MSICGFGIIRNAVKYDYPIVESIRSALPLVDEFILLVGKSDDETLALVKNIDPKVKIFESIWDDTLREGGRVLAVETDKALALVPDKYTWALYLQADEVLHEQDHENIRQSCSRWAHDDKVEGLLFAYKHFYGSYDYVATSSRWYRNEIRVVKNKGNVFSFRDAQGFRKQPDEKLKVKISGASVYHYGWVKPPEKMQIKQYDFQKLWHKDDWINHRYSASGTFDYSSIDHLEKYDAPHPSAIKQRIALVNWRFERPLELNKKTFKERVKDFFEKIIGWRPGEYKNYTLLKGK